MDRSDDTLIIGAGPAGLQLAYFLETHGRSYRVLERADVVGSFFRKYPRHRTLISVNKVHTGIDDPETNLRWDWNSLLCDDPSVLLSRTTDKYWPQADDYVRYLGEFAERFALRIETGVEVERIERRDGGFRVHDRSGGVSRCERLVVATGVPKPYVPEVPGIELAEVYTEVSVDPNDFVGQRVLVLGKGNSGFETATALVEKAAVIHIASRTPVHFAWKTHYVGHLRAINAPFLDTYQLKLQNAVLDGTILGLRREGAQLAVRIRYAHADDEEEELLYDRVILCTGFRFDASIFDESCRPALCIDERFPAQTSAWESTNVPGLYFAGTLMQARDHKKYQSGFIHGFRYNVRSLFRILEARHEGVALPAARLPLDGDAIADAILARVNRSSGLWQQNGFLCDVIAVDRAAGTARHLEELPFAFVHEELGLDEHWTVSLEFGHIEGDPFAIERKPSPEHAARSTFLHPVVRAWSRGMLVAEHHVIEELSGEWRKPTVHRAPLRAFLEETIARGSGSSDRWLASTSSGTHRIDFGDAPASVDLDLVAGRGGKP